MTPGTSAEGDAPARSHAAPGGLGLSARKIVFGVERTILCTFNQELFEAQTRTLAREICKRKRKLQTLQTRLRA